MTASRERRRPAPTGAEIVPLVSVVIPARNEADNLPRVLSTLSAVLNRERIPHQVVVVDDGSQDATPAVLASECATRANLTTVRRDGEPGIGRAIARGLESATGRFIAPMMADGSDAPEDLVRCLRKAEEGFDCVFGSRFIDGARVTGYPPMKLAANRLANRLLQLLFATGLNDLTNAFKLYRADALRSSAPYRSTGFEITIEMSLSAIARGDRIAQIPISWRGREHGVSKLRLLRQAPRYAAVAARLWCRWIAEMWRRRDSSPANARAPR